MSSPSWRICVDFGTAMSKAAAAPSDGASWAPARPLAIGRLTGEPSPYLATSALFIGDERVNFGRRALACAEIAVPQKREALLSFKLLLSAHNLSEVLALRAPKAIDPGGRFRYRDLVVSYIAWLVHLIDDAAAYDVVIGVNGTIPPLRYTRPAWQLDTEAEGRAHELVARLFDEACAMCLDLGAALNDPEGVPIADICAALTRARETSGPSRVESCVPEALSAIAFHAISAERGRPPAVWLVVDMGAGTTDIGAIAIVDGVAREIADARRVFATAGDQLDRILLGAFLTRAQQVRGAKGLADVWRRLLVSVREEKEGLFAEGRASVNVDGKPVVVKRREVEGDPGLKGFRDLLLDAYRISLEAASTHARLVGADSVSVVLAGGGANLSFLREMALRHKPKNGISVELHPNVPAWASSVQYGGQVAPVFVQLAVALGGAMAPPALLSVVSDKGLRAPAMTGAPA